MYRSAHRSAHRSVHRSAPVSAPVSAPITAPVTASVGVAATAPSADQTVLVPDIGDFDTVEVIELLVKPGDRVSAEQSLITVESDKASMEIPSSAQGVVRSVLVAIGDKVSKGSPIVVIATGEQAAAASASVASPLPAAADAPVRAQPAPAADPAPPRTASAAQAGEGVPVSDGRVHPVPAELHGAVQVVKPHASPSVRQFARELGVDLHLVRGTGPKQRITQDDVRSFVKGVVTQAASAPAAAPAPAAAASGGGAALGLIAWPKIDFAKFGAVEAKPLSRIKKISGANLHRNWVMIPHVTNHDDADITELEALRVQLNKENDKGGVKVTMLAFLIKACVSALRKFPEFNASLDGESLVYKRYFHIGFAADTPNGLVVPVVRDADQKGVYQIARETGELAAKARDGKLGPGDMQGGCFSISSLGGIGGTYFTPIINAPEVAILGVCRSSTRPVWDGKQFAPRLILPLSLSYDHRVIDGAAAARFNAHLGQVLADFRRVLL
ncbi:MAG: dihydrolipoyllysine-residue acetyltransferase [Burkholderiaceae bacterium]|nr:dihydrolipoyllysine-residue acetyltransferase [Burkholderiaceae bacterium]